MLLKFCKTCWVENDVLKWALYVLPNITTSVKAVEGKKIPKRETKMHETVRNAWNRMEWNAGCFMIVYWKDEWKSIIIVQICS